MDRYLSLKMFIRESLINYKKPDKTGFAILHALIAVELALKERLYSVNPHLIYEDIDSNGKKTIMLSKIPIRLKNLGIALEEKHCDLIRKMAEWRNDLVHNIPSHNPSIAKKEIGNLYDFFFSFITNELNKQITDILTPKEISRMKDIINEAQKIINKSKESASNNEGACYPFACKECNEQGVVGKKNKTAFCFLCNEHKLEVCCELCEKQLPYYSSLHFEDIICHTCTECAESAADEYISRLLDYSRGK